MKLNGAYWTGRIINYDDPSGSALKKRSPNQDQVKMVENYVGMLTYDHTYGWRGIRTPGIFPNTSVFKTDSLNRSDIHPFPDRIMSHQ